MDWLGVIMGWLEDNLAVLSALFVPVLLGVIGPLTSREAGGRQYRRVRRHAHLRGLLGDGSSAAERMDALLDSEIKMLADRQSRKLNGANLAAIVVVSIFGAAISFGLVTWAQWSVGFWAWVAWIVFGAWTLFIVLLVFVGGLANLYKQDEKS